MNSFLVILISFFISIALTISTFPLGSFSPDWIHLFLIYWILAAPKSVGLVVSWMIGLTADVVVGSTLGANALVYVLISYIILKTYKTIRYLTVFQQGIIVLFLLIFKYTILLWIDKLLTIGNYGLSVYWIPLVSAIIWPIIFFSLRSIRRRYNIK
tara:strand:- start:233 stop:700 length:468 start_codon:yes stop_codon:yes gene_type:complete